MRMAAGLPLSSISPWRLGTQVRLRGGRGGGFALATFPRRGCVHRRGIALRRSVYARDPPFVGLQAARRFLELLGEFGGDLKARIAVEYPDGADLALRHVAGAAKQREKPAWIGVALTADIDPEPHHVAAVVPHGARSAVIS